MTITGYLLSYVKYNDHDAIVHFFTREMGFQTYFMKGIYTAKNKKKAYLSPLNEITFVVNDHQKLGLLNISKIEQVKAVECSDVRASSVAFFIAEFLQYILKSEVKQENIYQAIEVFANQLSNRNYQAHFVFLVELLNVQGISPLIGEGNFLNPESGCFEEARAHRLFNEEISTLWKNFILENDNIYGVKIKNSLKGDFLDSVLLYYHCHFPDFKTPKSLDILKQIFAD